MEKFDEGKNETFCDFLRWRWNIFVDQYGQFLPSFAFIFALSKHNTILHYIKSELIIKLLVLGLELTTIIILT